MRPKDAEGIANSVDPDQTAPVGARRSLIWVCTVVRIITVPFLSVPLFHVKMKLLRFLFSYYPTKKASVIV